MPSGREHETSALVALTPVAITTFTITSDVSLTLTSVISFWFGSYYLSPDLDIASRPYRRWGYLRHYWWLYRELVAHRSSISHSPILSTVFRLLYLSPVWLSLFYFYLPPFPYLLTVFLSLCAADLLHIIADRVF